MFDSEQNKDHQAEFFADLPTASGKPNKVKFRLSKVALSLSYENIFLLTIGLIMLLIVCYSLGVEKGKRFVQLKSEEIAIEQEQAQELPAVETEEPKQKKTYIQVASFRSEKYARKEIERLKNKGYQSYLTQWGKFQVVCVGNYQDRKAAAEDLRKLKQIYGDCYVRLTK